MNTQKLLGMVLVLFGLSMLTTGVACQPAAPEPSPPPTAATSPAASPAPEKSSPEALPVVPALPPAETSAQEAKTPPAAVAPVPSPETATEPPAEQGPILQPANAREPKPVEPAATPAIEEKPAEPKPAEPATAPATDATTAAPAEKPAAVAPSALPAPVPLGLPALPVPADNPLTAEKVALGRMLYFDKRLSRDGTISCATCHDPQMAWAEQSSTSTGIDHQVGDRNSPTVINAAYATTQFWDGRAASLEEQALGPIENPIEMGHSLPALVEQLQQVPEYRQRFQEVFGAAISKENLAQAIAAFERTILSGNSPYDRFVAGDAGALNDAQKRGWEKFQASCAQCHKPPLFSNYQFYNAGVGMDKESPDPGRKKITGRELDLGKFRVPALRDVAKTAPYFHDGSVATLEEAVALMAQGGRDNSKLSSALKTIRNEQLTPQDQQDLVAFLEALSGEYPVIAAPPLP